MVQHWNLPAGGVIGRYRPVGAVRRYYVKDHLGSVRQEVDASGTVLTTYGEDYYPFGLQMPGRSMVSDAPKERFTGHELDDETGLYYAGARYLDPVIGRWLSVDPLADKFPAWSPYNYVLNNPVKLMDPDGKQPCCDFMDVMRLTFGGLEGPWNRMGHRIESSSQSMRQGIAEGTSLAVEVSGVEGAIEAPAEIGRGSEQIGQGLSQIQEGQLLSGTDNVLGGLQRQLSAGAEMTGAVENLSAVGSLTPAAPVTAPIFGVASPASTMLDGTATAIEFARMFTGGSSVSSFLHRTGYAAANAIIPGRISRNFQGREQAAEALVGNGLDEVEEGTQPKNP